MSNTQPASKYMAATLLSQQHSISVIAGDQKRPNQCGDRYTSPFNQGSLQDQKYLQAPPRKQGWLLGLHERLIRPWKRFGRK